MPRITRRGFLAAAVLSVSTVTVGAGLAPAFPRLRERYKWASANHQYSYGIDPRDPLDIVVYHNTEERFVFPDELSDRANARYYVERECLPGEMKVDADVMYDECAVDAVAQIMISQSSLVLGREGMLGSYDFGEMAELPHFVIPTHDNTVIVG